MVLTNLFLYFVCVLMAASEHVFLVASMICGYHSCSYGTVSSLYAQGVALPPSKMLPFNVSFTAKSRPLKLDFYPALGSLGSLQVC